LLTGSPITCDVKKCKLKTFPQTSKPPTLTKMSVYKTNQQIELFRTQQKKKNQKQSFKKILKTSVSMQNKNPLSSNKKNLLQKNHKNLSTKLYS
jgi:hypothetical protein